MSRGLGRRQRTVLMALRALDARRPGQWWSPAELLIVLAPPPKPAPEPVFDPDERTDGPRLAHLRTLVAKGWSEYWPTVREIEARIAWREADRRARAAAERRRATNRYPNQRRPMVRGGEEGNPSRVLALLERRGLIERVARCGPGSVVRLVAIPA